MAVRGIRGAITIEQDTPEEIQAATLELLGNILKTNPTLDAEDVASVFFTVTEDICSGFPATAVRLAGWNLVPLFCCTEIPVPGSLRFCIRILIHWNTELPQTEITHVYLRQAISLRPDLETN
ncbi:MAG: chorismate mutase [Anaerolineales bacterium]|nr:chorismate mutase [Anaerolineales bacterium]